MSVVLVKCGFCAGSGSILAEEEAPYPPNTFGAHANLAEMGLPYQETRSVQCPVCLGGTRVRAPTDDETDAPVECPKCNGRGYWRDPEDRTMPAPCKTCRGTGHVGGEPAG